MTDKPEKKEEFMASFELSGGSRKLETDIDVLYNLIKENRIIKMAAVVKKLNFPKEKILGWADILEEHNMIDIDYPVVGDPVFKVKMSRSDEKKWLNLEKKTKDSTKKHTIKLSKTPIFFIFLIGLGFVFIYMTSLRYILFNRVLTFIYGTPIIMNFLNTLPIKDYVFVNIVHITFGTFVSLTIIVFLVWRFLLNRIKNKANESKHTGSEYHHIATPKKAVKHTFHQPKKPVKHKIRHTTKRGKR